jgi:transcriptional regulator with XRE-family HTH domain
MITSAQLRAARALLGIDQRKLAQLSGVSLPTIQRMEASDGNVRGIVGTLTKVIEALRTAGVEVIGEYMRSEGEGRGVRLRHAKEAERGRLLAMEDNRRLQASRSL